ncbi:MAG: hypothetical protein ABSA78_16395 [Candidatus Sulfotelmatobacter sp.]|jgi:hypothetical protein
MQTLNVGAGKTDQEYKEAEEQRRTDLRNDSQSDAKYFFWAAGLAALASGLFDGLSPLRLNILVNIGIFDILRLYGRPLLESRPLAYDGIVGAWMIGVVGLGFAARAGHRWAFLVGLILYGADMIALMATFSIWAIGIHAFFVLRWFQGQKALKDLSEAPAII